MIIIITYNRILLYITEIRVMELIKNHKFNSVKLLTSTCLVLTATQNIAMADNTPIELDTLSIEGEENSGYLTKKSASRKYVKPLLDTAQTITVVPKQVIEDQGQQDLKAILSNISGITFNAGEGGGGLGDSINIRGFSANSNIQIDGLRDSAQTNRSDTFNLEQVEVIKGPNSVFGGAGTTGGSINIITKRPLQESFTKLSGTLGTDNYRRLTLDTNQQLTNNIFFRLNMMTHANDIAERDWADKKRWGIAPSIAFGLNTNTRLILSYVHQQDRNLPDYGVPAIDGKRIAGFSRSDYLGWRNLDQENTNSDILTAVFEHDFNDNLTIQNQSRYSYINRDTVISASHINTSKLPAGYFKPAGPQAYGRHSKVDMWINQTNLNAKFDTFGLAHTALLGTEFSHESYDRTTYSYNIGNYYPSGGYPIGQHPGYWYGPASKRHSARNQATLVNKAVYLFDSIALNKYVDIDVGLRYDWIDGEAKSASVSAKTGNRMPYTSYDSNIKKLSTRYGLVFKPADNGRIYVAYGTSFNPSAEALASTGGGVTAKTESLDPEKNKTWELGTKWTFFDKRLELDSAIFRVEKSNARETMADGTTQLAGKQRVQGFEMGLTGKVTEQWNIFANYTFLDSETLKAANTNSGIAKKGQALGNTPPHSFNIWNTYQLPAGFRIGYGAQYVSKRNVTSSTQAKLPDYWVHNAMLGYKINKNVDLQLNVNNVFNKTYVSRVRQVAGTNARSSAIEYGDARTALLTMNVSF